MPIYEYKCRECGELSEFRILSQSDAEKIACKSCGSKQLEKKFSVPSISSGRKESGGQSCCGSPGSCSEPGRCCGH
jgi:putative FmdB family regulatory protein